MWLRMLAVTLTYYVAGQLGRLLAIPPGYASALWPASGIALAGFLLCGYRIWPGILLASFLINLQVSLDTGALGETMALSAGIALGTVLSSVTGAVLIRRVVGFPNPLNHDRDVTTFLLLGGPVSCLISPTVGVGLLRWADKIPAQEVPYTWWTWWIGESIGVMLLTPLVLLWVNRRQPDWPRRPLIVSVPLGILTSLVVALFLYTEAHEQERIQSEFDFQTNTLKQAMENEFEYALMALTTSRGNHGNFANTSDKNKYKKMAENILSRRAPVEALSWAPRVSDRDRQKFERAGAKILEPNFSIWQMNADNKSVPAPERKEYFPILYRQPRSTGSDRSYGFDVASAPDRVESQRRAVETAEPVASPLIEPTRRVDSQKTILVFLPIYRDGAPPDSPEERRNAHVGFMVAVLRTGQMVKLAWQGFKSEGIDFWFYDESAKLAHYHGSRQGIAEGPANVEDTSSWPNLRRTSTTIRAAGREWTLRFVQTPEYLTANRSWQGLTILAAGMLFTGLLGGVLLVLTGREALIAGLVAERTAELARANTAMSEEIRERQRAAAALDESRRFAERIAEMMPSILYVYDLQTQRNIFVNSRFQSILGYSTEAPQPSLAALFRDNIHPQDWPRVETVNEQFLSAEEDVVVEMEFRMKDAGGEWRWLESRATIFRRDNEGVPCEVLGIMQDITRRKHLEEEVLDIAAQEQRRIGQELHDGTGQELTGLCMLADNLADMLRHDAAEAQRARRVAQGLQHALSHVRTLSRGLIPVEVDAEGLMAALTDLTGRISDIHSVRCVFECAEPVPIEDNFVATQLFRIAQEAITNALKHGKARNIRVGLETKEPYFTLKISDDGVGMTNGQDNHEGMGLRIMKYRAGQIGAQFAVRAAPTRGTVVTCTLFRNSAP
jgi:PAS domain S-box-containing protein